MSPDQTISESRASDNQGQLDWARLTREIAAGDADSFGRYYEYFFERMYKQAKQLTAMDESSCLDIVQNAMMKAIKGMKPMQDETHVAAWTRVVVRNAAFDYLRKTARRMERGLTSEAIAKNENADLFDVQARLEWIEQQLRKLAPDLRRMVLLRYRLGWSLKEVATKFGLKTGAVDGRIRRAVEELRQQAEWEYHE